MSVFRPPIVRSAGAILDRALFAKTIPIAAARIHNPRNLAKYRKELEGSRDTLVLERLKNIVQDPNREVAEKGGKCVLLKPEIKANGEFSGRRVFGETWLIFLCRFIDMERGCEEGG